MERKESQKWKSWGRKRGKEGVTIGLIRLNVCVKQFAPLLSEFVQCHPFPWSGPFYYKSPIEPYTMQSLRFSRLSLSCHRMRNMLMPSIPVIYLLLSSFHLFFSKSSLAWCKQWKSKVERSGRERTRAEGNTDLLRIDSFTKAPLQCTCPKSSCLRVNIPCTETGQAVDAGSAMLEMESTGAARLPSCNSLQYADSAARYSSIWPVQTFLHKQSLHGQILEERHSNLNIEHLKKKKLRRKGRFSPLLWSPVCSSLHLAALQQRAQTRGDMVKVCMPCPALLWTQPCIPLLLKNFY